MLKKLLEDAIKKLLTGDSSADKSNEPELGGAIGRYAIVRSYNEGVNAGVVISYNKDMIELSDCRRLWRHWPKDKKKSWYEGVAISGLDEKSQISIAVPTKIIVEKYSITICSKEAEQSIREFASHEQA